VARHNLLRIAGYSVKPAPKLPDAAAPTHELSNDGPLAAEPLLPHRTLSLAVVARLRDEILRGQLPAGTALKQSELAQRFGVSRIPVREALFQLEAEGLVRMEPHRGGVVAEFALDEMADVFELRCILEPRLLRAAVPLMAAADHARIAKFDAAFSRAIATNDIAQWGSLNASFHAAMYRPARLPKTQATVTALLQTSDRYTRLQLKRAQALERAQHEHRELAALCLAANAEAACALLVAHIESVYADLRTLLAHPVTPVQA
jgi:DNA-binding GntR family transcriptional regulator